MYMYFFYHFVPITAAIVFSVLFYFQETICQKIKNKNNSSISSEIWSGTKIRRILQRGVRRDSRGRRLLKDTKGDHFRRMFGSALFGFLSIKYFWILDVTYNCSLLPSHSHSSHSFLSNHYKIEDILMFLCFFFRKLIQLMSFFKNVLLLKLNLRDLT